MLQIKLILKTKTALHVRFLHARERWIMQQMIVLVDVQVPEVQYNYIEKTGGT